LVESSLYAVSPTDAGISFEVFRHSSRPLELQAIPKVSLPCSSVPLQSEVQQLVIENHAKPNRVEYTMARLPRRGAVLHPIVEELTRIVSPIPRCNQSRVQATSELVAEILDNASHEVWILSAETAQAIVMCWFTSPTPSVLRVSHSLNGFIPPELCGSISHHIHPQDSGLQSFPLSASRNTFRCPFLSCC
jgi:hypothetical protein